MQVHIKLLDDSNCSTICNMKGASVQGRHSHITGVQARCKKIEMICMHWFDGHLTLHSGPGQWGGGIPNVAVQQMSYPPPVHHPGPCLWNVDLAYLLLVVRLMKMTHQGLFHRWLATLLAMVTKGQQKHFLHTRPNLQYIFHKWLTTASSFCPSFPHHRQWVTPFK